MTITSASSHTHAYNYYLGLTSRDEATTFKRREAEDRVAAYLADEDVASGGATFTRARGRYKHTSEKTLEIYICGITSAEHHALIDWLCSEFQQESVGVTDAPSIRFESGGEAAAAAA